MEGDESGQHLLLLPFLTFLTPLVLRGANLHVTKESAGQNHCLVESWKWTPKLLLLGAEEAQVPETKTAPPRPSLQQEGHISL